MEDVKQKWEDKKHYFEQYKKDGACPPCIDLDRATLGAIEDSKALHARRWQTKEGTYRVVRFPLTPLHFHHFRAPSLPRRSTHARIWTPPLDASCQWVCCPALHLNPDSNHPLIRCTSPMSLMLGSSIRFIFPSPLCRNLLLPQFCCLIRLCKCKLWPVLATLLTTFV